MFWPSPWFFVTILSMVESREEGVRRAVGSTGRSAASGGVAVALGLAVGVWACSEAPPASFNDSIGIVRQAMSCEGGPDVCPTSDGGMACTLDDASTAGLQGNCPSGQWCNLATTQCQSAFLPPGAPIPLPNNTFGCSDIAARSACSSGACNLNHDACGCQVNEDCASLQTCDNQTFDCAGPVDAGVGSDAAGGVDAAGGDAAVGGDASAQQDAGGPSSNDAGLPDVVVSADPAARVDAGSRGDSGQEGRTSASSSSSSGRGGGGGGGCTTAGSRVGGGEGFLVLGVLLLRRRRTSPVRSRGIWIASPTR